MTLNWMLLIILSEYINLIPQAGILGPEPVPCSTYARKNDDYEEDCKRWLVAI